MLSQCLPFEGLFGCLGDHNVSKLVSLDDLLSKDMDYCFFLKASCLLSDDYWMCGLLHISEMILLVTLRLSLRGKNSQIPRFGKIVGNLALL